MREREGGGGEREKDFVLCVCMCVSLLERGRETYLLRVTHLLQSSCSERERERERERETDRETEKGLYQLYSLSSVY